MQDLLQLIKTRQSSRIPFDPARPVPDEDLQKIMEAASWAPTPHNMQNFEAVVVNDKNLLQQIRDIDFPVSAVFIKENYLQLSFSEEELKTKKVGVLGTMFPKSWLHPGQIPEHTVEKEPEDPSLQRHNQLLDCPVLIILLYNPRRRAPASEGDFLGIMGLGCVLENMWLMAESLGIGFHVVSAISGEIVEAKIKKILKIPDPLSIAISFRLGYPLRPANSLRVRRDIRDFTHYNGFGH